MTILRNGGIVEIDKCNFACDKLSGEKETNLILEVKIACGSRHLWLVNISKKIFIKSIVLTLI